MNYCLLTNCVLLISNADSVMGFSDSCVDEVIGLSSAKCYTEYMILEIAYVNSLFSLNIL